MINQSLHAYELSRRRLLRAAGAAALPWSASCAPAEAAWVGTWSMAPQPPLPAILQRFHNQTLRFVVHTSIGGVRVRAQISNRFGDTPLVIGAARLARRAADAAIAPETDRVLTVGGQSSFTVPAGGEATTDPVDLDIPALSDVAVSLYLPQQAAATTTHLLALQTNYIASEVGDHTGASDLPNAETMTSWSFLTRLDVAPSGPASAIVAFGDSMIDGDGSTPDTNSRWTDELARRLQQSQLPLGVLNQGMIGNRLLRDSPESATGEYGRLFGRSGLNRFEQDVAVHAGARYVIVRFGANDIGFPGAFAPESDAPSADDLIAGYRRLITMARERGLAIIGTTLTPFENTTLKPGYYTPEKEPVRRAVNAWLRDAREFDALLDFDEVVRDSSQPSRLDPRFDCGDHIHVNDRGYAAIAEAIPLSLFST